MSLANQGKSVAGIAAVEVTPDDLLDDRPEMPILIRFAPEDCKACTPARTGSHTRPGNCRNDGTAPGRERSARDAENDRLPPWREDSLRLCALRSLLRYFEAVTGSELMPGVIAAIQTFGDRINAHPHLHFLVTEGGVDETGLFHKVPRIDDSRLASLFAREVLSNLVGRELLSPEWADRLLSWRHTGFNVHSRVRARTKAEAERVGKYMIRPLLSLERLSFLEVCVQFVSVATGK